MDSFPFLRPVAPERTPQSFGGSARGFTLVEMMVVLAIIIVITAIVITGQSTYNETLLLTDTTYTVAFSVRQAQSLGLASRNYGSAGAAQNVGYGVYFSSGAPTSYTVFADTSNAQLSIPAACTVGTAGTPEWKPGNCRYNAADGIVQTYSFDRGYRISKFCGKNGSGPLQCSNTGLTGLDIVYMRPNTISVLTGRGSSGQTIPFTCVQLHVAAPAGAERVIRVSQLGEVSTNQVCP